MTLVDTSVWVDHFRRGSPRLSALLLGDQVLCHPFVLGEVACGHLRSRSEVLGLMGALPQSRVTEHGEVLYLIETARLHGLGLGWIDVHLLASALVTRCNLWTLDKTLERVAAWLKIRA